MYIALVLGSAVKYLVFNILVLMSGFAVQLDILSSSVSDYIINY